MKNIFTIALILLATLTLSAQKRNVPIAADTAQGNTVYFEPNYTIAFLGASTYTGVVGIQFTKTDVADSCSSIKLQGSRDGSNFVDVTDATAYLENTTTDGNFFLYDENPIYLKYRLAATAATGDTTIFSNVGYIWKEGE